jgi:putative ribosome biogenesis GTPase RsgA
MRVPTAAEMEDAFVHELSVLGFGPFFEQQLRSSGGDEVTPARIAAEHRGAFEVWSTAGAGRARLAGRLRLELEDASLPGVGDLVVLRDAPTPSRTTVIESVLERRTAFTRGAAGRDARAQVVAANVDQVFSEGIEAVRACIRDGLTVALVGSSGAGKSTLVNALLGEERMRTGQIRPRDGRGCHVTTHRQFVLLPGGGLLLDTPGMRELELVDEDGLETVFGEVAVLAGRCRFRDCRHDTEPDCAVREAVEAGELDADRFEHYRTLQREALAFELRHDERKRRQAERVWGQLSDEVARLRKWKGGKP